MRMCRPSTGKTRPYLWTIFYPRAVVMNEVHFPVYKPVGYTCNSSLISVLGAHAAGESIFCREAWDAALHKILWRDLSKVKEFSWSQ